MKFFAALLVMACLSFSVGCTHKDDGGSSGGGGGALCSVGKSVSSLIAAAVGNQLACKNLDQVKADIDAQLVKTNVCSEDSQKKLQDAKLKVDKQKGVFAVFCSPVIDALMAGAVSQIPSSWECGGGAPADTIKSLALAACQRAL